MSFIGTDAHTEHRNIIACNVIVIVDTKFVILECLKNFQNIILHTFVDLRIIIIYNHCNFVLL